MLTAGGKQAGRCVYAVCGNNVQRTRCMGTGRCGKGNPKGNRHARNVRGAAERAGAGNGSTGNRGNEPKRLKTYHMHV